MSLLENNLVCHIAKTKIDNKEHHGQMVCLESRKDLLPLAEDLFLNSLLHNMEHTGKWISLTTNSIFADILKVSFALRGTNNGWLVWTDLYQVCSYLSESKSYQFAQTTKQL